MTRGLAASHMAGVLADLQHVHTFLSSQKRLVSADVFDKMMDAQANMFARRFEHDKGDISLADATSLSDAISSGPWTSAQQKRWLRSLH